MKKHVLLMALLAAAGLVSAAENVYNAPEKWSAMHPRIKYQPEDKGDGVLAVPGYHFIYSDPAVKFSPEKKYRMTGSFRKAGEEPASIYFGLAFFDEKGRRFDLANSNAVPKSDTEVTAEAKKGDTEIRIKDGSGWKKFKSTIIAFNTAPDYSDLPNFNLIRIPIKSVTEADGGCTVTLTRPLPVNIPAGTTVRLHLPGGTVYFAVNRKLGADWQKFDSRVFSGITKGAGMGVGGLFPRGTVEFRVLLITNLGLKKSSTLEFKDVKIIEE